LRKRYQAFSRGSLEFLHPANKKILAFRRCYQQEQILVVANLSRFVQQGDLDLSGHQGLVPVELFGRTPLPRIGKQPYPLTLGPHSFYWFVLEAQKGSRTRDPEKALKSPLPKMISSGDWEELFQHPGKKHLEAALSEYFRRCRWAGQKVDGIKSAKLRHAFRLVDGDSPTFLCLVEFEYLDSPPELLVFPLALAQGEKAVQLQEHSPGSLVACFQGDGGRYLFDALEDSAFREAVLKGIASGKTHSFGDGDLVATAFGSPAWSEQLAGKPLSSSLGPEEQTNTSVIYSDRLILKFFRRIEEGIHPEVECGRYLTEKKEFGHVAPVLGSLDYRFRKREPITLAVLHSFVPNVGTAWQYTLDE
jgi:maltose alpha-D-glucosyltransferase/alpha-amylase